MLFQAITARLKKKHDFKPRDVLHLAGALWVIVMLSFAFGGVWGPFLHIVACASSFADANLLAHFCSDSQRHSSRPLWL